MKRPVNYVDNAHFLSLLVDYRNSRLKSINDKTPIPKIPDSIGKILVQIANNLSTRFNFINYTYRDEMISDGILDAIKAVNNFSPDIGKNPFGYFTRIIYYAFVRKIKYEKREQKMYNEMMFELNTDFFALQEGDSCEINKDETYLWYNN